MAKRGKGKAVETAENIGAALGRAAAKFDAWKRQRTEIAAELTRVVTAAQGMLSHVRPEGAKAAGAADRGARRTGTQAGGRKTARPAAAGKTKRTLSAAARAKISAAQKKRWAERKKAQA